jgi:hypothetical protein
MYPAECMQQYRIIYRICWNTSGDVSHDHNKLIENEIFKQVFRGVEVGL